jgi:crossover junction endodeoxyribonuclease RusA
MIVLTLPYPVSANRYWQSFVPAGARRALVHLSTEAKQFKRDVAAIAHARGIVKPLEGRIAVHMRLFPNRPLDWKKRQTKLGAWWDDTVQCIDLGNCEKVTSDALQGIVYEDDKRIRRLLLERMEPDEHGARVIVAIEQLAIEQRQGDLLVAA